jgi:hypothetical protein
MKKDEMGVTCGTHRTMQKCIYSFSRETRRYHSEDLGTDRRIILKCTSGRFLSTW